MGMSHHDDDGPSKQLKAKATTVELPFFILSVQDENENRHTDEQSTPALTFPLFIFFRFFF